MALEAVLFDVDGTLVDSNDLHVDAWVAAFTTHGHDVDREAIRGQIGKGGDLLVPTLLPGLGEKEQDELAEAHGQVFKDQYLHRVRPFPGAHDLLAAVHGAGVRVAVASSASQAELDHYLDLLDARELVSATSTSDEVEASKPEGDIFSVVLEKLGVPAERAVAVGDTPYDAEAAGKCGVRTVAVRSGGFDPDALREAGAAALYDDVAAVLRDFPGSLAG